jgi:hypothetical protein
MIIQVVLIAIFVALILQIVAQPLFPALLKLGSPALVAAGILFVLFPSLTNRLAHVLGVGRGADLFLYLAISCGAVLLFNFYLRLRSLELRQVELVRQLALQQYEITHQNRAEA